MIKNEDLYGILIVFMKKNDYLRRQERIDTAEKISGFSGNTIFPGYTITWKTGGYCLLDRNEPTNYVHFHNCWEGHIVLSGKGALRNGNNTFPVKEASLLLSAPGIPHEITAARNDSLSLFWFLFDIRKTGDFPAAVNTEYKIIDNFLRSSNSTAENSWNIFSYLEFMREYNISDNNEKIWIERIFGEMLLFFMEQLSRIESPVKSQVNENRELFVLIAGYIRNNIDRNLSLGEISDFCGKSPRSLQYYFKKNLGITLKKFIHEIKADHAAKALLRGIRVQEAGELIGIPDPSQFSRFFKSHFGISPGSYRGMSIEEINFFSTVFESSGYRKFI